MTTTIFNEAIDLTEATIDTTNHILRDVVLIRAGESANKRDYPADVLAASVPVFEGVNAFMNHPTRDQIKRGEGRGLQEFTGVYRNVRFENNMLKADRVFSPNAAGRDAMAIAEAVVNGSLPRTAVGLSINAVGRARKDNDKVIVEAITAAESVDDVVNAAAGGSYVEDARNNLASAFYETLDYDEWLTIREDFTARYAKEHHNVRRNADLEAALQERDKYRTRVEALEAELKQSTEAREAAVQTAQLAERQVQIVDALAKVSLPASWKQSLTQLLMEAEPTTWAALIQAEISKAKSAGHKPRVEVNVPGPQESKPPKLAVTESLAPRDDEDPQQWQERIQRIREGK